ncbi:MAG: 4Fe-4S dicluster domain-containing protein [Bacillota bacterium]|nr:4Fe-4S dicluster domain-containing protein [Bacillota bacterium]
MITFETQLKKLKHLVLKEVITLAKEDKVVKEELEKIPYSIISGSKAEYRCCVYKERAVVYERAQIASGFKPNDNTTKPLEAFEDDQIIHVIEAACDSCPIERYTVTEACRGCLQHKCMEVCPAKAVVRVDGKAFINHDLCKECGMCKKVCPYNAIAEVARPCKKACPTAALDIKPEDKRAMIKKEDCIQCGACMAACPFGAISDRSYVVPVTKALVEGKKVYAVVAPAIAGQFGPKVSVGQVKAALKKAGFADMLEAACGADAVTVHESNEFVERMEKGDKYMTNSCCPGFLSYIEKKFPTEAEKISGTVSPMIATARAIKKADPEAVVIFAGPCTAKKSEILRPSLKGEVDYTLTFEEVAALLDAFDLDPEACENVVVDDGSMFGRGFAQLGGLTAAVENYIQDKGIDIQFKPVKASGTEEIKKAMTMAKVGKLDGNFIEGMMCEGGCVGGPAAAVSQMKSKVQVAKFSKESPKKAVIANEKLATDYENLDLER